MFDPLLRPVKERLIHPLARVLAGRVSPLTLTVAGAVLGLAAAGTILLDWMLAALILWLLSRLLDGLDGVVARVAALQSDLGGYLDLLLDVLVYAVIPVSLAVRAGFDDPLGVSATLVLLALFYVNIVSWAVLSSILEKRRAAGADSSDGAGSPDRAGPRRKMTSVAMPSGLIEGTETLIFYTLFLLLPAWYPLLAFVMAGLTALTIMQRVVWARSVLPSLESPPGDASGSRGGAP
mgnify:CR=1 FL=1